MRTEKPAPKSSHRKATLTSPISKKSESWWRKYLWREAVSAR